MDQPKPLDSLFKEKLFRIPDYQRGYAWGREQLDAFWEDLINLPRGRSHYTGVLTLKEIPSTDIRKDEVTTQVSARGCPSKSCCNAK